MPSRAHFHQICVTIKTTVIIVGIRIIRLLSHQCCSFMWPSVLWPWTSYAKLRAAHAPGMPGTFSPPPWVSDPDMHHGTCVTHVPWCMPGSLTSGLLWSQWRGKRSRYSWRNSQFYVSGKKSMREWWAMGLQCYALWCHLTLPAGHRRIAVHAIIVNRKFKTEVSTIHRIDVTKVVWYFSGTQTVRIFVHRSISG